MRVPPILNVLVVLLCAGGCDRAETSAKDTSKGVTPSTPTSPARQTAIPANVFLAAAPADAKPVKAAKDAAKNGEKVTLVGRIGRGEEPFVKNRAVFTIVDLSIKYCGEVGEDACKTPWDYCCEPNDVMAANSATVQIVGPNGSPLKEELSGVSGLKPLAVVEVVGTVAQKDGDVFVVNAERLFVRP